MTQVYTTFPLPDFSLSLTQAQVRLDAKDYQSNLKTNIKRVEKNLVNHQLFH